MLALAADPAFDAFVDRELSAHASRAGSFAELLAMLPGIGPQDALRGLQAGIDQPAFADLIHDALSSNLQPRAFDQGALLPLPHPLDMEWRFSTATVQFLLQQAIASTVAGDPILLLGVPSIAAHATSTSIDRVFQVVGEDNAVCLALKRASLRDPRFTHGLSERRARAVIVDPPWYIDAYVEMLAICSAHSEIGSLLLLALPPEGIRPSARADRAKMIEVALAAGYEVQEKGEELRYRTPFFELEALRAAGIHAWLPEWRTGELVRLVKVRDTVCDAGYIERPAAFDLTIEGVRLRLLLDRVGPGELVPLVQDGTLPSVSARYPGRDRATLWTSGNKAFEVDSTLALAAMTRVAEQRNLVLPIRFTSKEISGSEARTIDAIQALTQEIDDLVRREIGVAHERLGGESWLRTLNDGRFSSGR